MELSGDFQNINNTISNLDFVCDIRQAEKESFKRRDFWYGSERLIKGGQPSENIKKSLE